MEIHMFKVFTHRPPTGVLLLRTLTSIWLHTDTHTCTSNFLPIVCMHQLWYFTYVYTCSHLTSTFMQISMAFITKLKSCKTLLGATTELALSNSRNRFNWIQWNTKLSKHDAHCLIQCTE